MCSALEQDARVVLAFDHAQPFANVQVPCERGLKKTGTGRQQQLKKALVPVVRVALRVPAHAVDLSRWLQARACGQQRAAEVCVALCTRAASPLPPLAPPYARPQESGRHDCVFGAEAMKNVARACVVTYDVLVHFATGLKR